MSNTVNATLITGISSAYGLQAHFSAAGNTIGINIDPEPIASGSSPNPYIVNKQLLNVQADIPQVLSLDTGTLASKCNI
ncbi:hypothetical protein [Candidatus Nitrosoglobus terrae]|nr:hypothetical protein [Candidatus Nitrosoglobus terrae]